MQHPRLVGRVSHDREAALASLHERPSIMTKSSREPSTTHELGCGGGASSLTGLVPDLGHRWFGL